ncbi:MAG: AMP-binding protein, partial [Selenomonas sp.]|nr:AMP-binding protein [Selenomonas sp.]
MGCKAEHTVLSVLPMYHVFGLTCSVFYPFSVGATVVILDSFTPKETISTIRDEKVTDLYIVPSICSLLTKLASGEDMKTVRLVVSGGTTLPLKIQQDFMGKFGVDICEGYGLSETSPVVTMNPPEKPKVGSCGPIVPGLKWRLIDAEGNDVPQGEAGELVVKGDNVMLGYWNLPDVTHDAMRGGWFHTGDVARADEEGYLFIVDRIKDMIISMGENIYPREVEELIYQFPGIYEAAVVGIEDKLRGQAGACFYSVQEGCTVNVRELKKFLQANLALYKIPREFHIMEKLPRTTTGKIAKKTILTEFQAGKIK